MWKKGEKKKEEDEGKKKNLQGTESGQRFFFRLVSLCATDMVLGSAW